MQVISSKDNELVKHIKKLKDKKYRDESNLFLVEGDHLVKEAYKAGYLKKLIVTEDIYDFDVEKLLVTDKVINSISDLNNTKVIGVCSKLSTNLDLSKNVVILDGVQDPGNLGTIIRSCVAFNINNLVLSNETVDLYNKLEENKKSIFVINRYSYVGTNQSDKTALNYVLDNGTKIDEIYNFEFYIIED